MTFSSFLTRIASSQTLIPSITYINVIIINFNFIIVIMLPRARRLKLSQTFEWVAEISEKLWKIHTSFDENNEKKSLKCTWEADSSCQFTKLADGNFSFSRLLDRRQEWIFLSHFISILCRKRKLQLTFPSTSHRTWLRLFQICNFCASRSSMHVWIRGCPRRCPIWSKSNWEVISCWF